MAIEILGKSSNVVDSDAGGGLFIRRTPATPVGSTGGAFSVAGGSIAVVAAALAANTPLASLRLGAAASVKAYITRLELDVANATVGASAGVAGAIGWQRFNTATPTGGTARTVARKDYTTGGGSAMSDARDSNAALTVTSVNFTDVFTEHIVPNETTGLGITYEDSFDEDEFICLAAGDGICLRTTVAMAATQTWVYTYAIHWLEK